MGVKLIKIAPPFKSSSNRLVLFNNYRDSDMQLTMDVDYLLEGEIEDNYKIKAFHLCLCLLNEFALNFAELPSSYEIFILIEKYVHLIPMDNYPEEVRKKCSMLKEEISTMKNNRTLQYIVTAQRRPKALRLYEPNIEKV